MKGEKLVCKMQLKEQVVDENAGILNDGQLFKLCISLAGKLIFM